MVPNVATFTIVQDNGNAEEEDSYYRAPGQQAPATPTALEGGNVSFASLDSLMADLGNIVGKDGSEARGSGSNVSTGKDSRPPPKYSESGLNGLGINTGTVCKQVFD